MTSQNRGQGEDMARAASSRRRMNKKKAAPSSSTYTLSLTQYIKH